jgi:phosphomannomutase
MTLACFKAYDIRGRIPSELNADLARNIGRAYVERFKARRVVVGRDMRLSSPEIARRRS